MPMPEAPRNVSNCPIKRVDRLICYSCRIYIWKYANLKALHLSFREKVPLPELQITAAATAATPS